LNVQI